MHSSPHLRARFIDAKTRMNPNLMFGQAIKGVVTERGIGIIDMVHLIEMAQEVKIMEEDDAFAEADVDTVKNWFFSYLNWMTMYEFDIAERDNGNNHRVTWALQSPAF